MNLVEFTSPLPKPWLQIVCDTLDAVEIRSTFRVRQAGGHLSSYGLWSAINSDSKISGTTPTFAMGSFVGPVAIPASQCYDGMTTRIVVGGELTTAGVGTVTFSIRDLAGTYVHASCSYTTGGATVSQKVKVEFNIQVAKAGGNGTGFERSVSMLNIANVNGSVNNNSDNTTFSTLNGVEYYLYIQQSVVGDSFLRQLAYATVMN